jgi:hypothetical protein
MTEEAKGKRLYVVTEMREWAGDMNDMPPPDKEKIVEAATQAQAIRTVVGNRFTARPASAYDVARIMATNSKESA